MGDRRSKEDHVNQISTSIYVTNFPEQFSYRDLWKECQVYGRVVDAYIPNRRSKAGNKFGFVRFIHIKDVERLVRNLCTIWVGRLRLHANVARFQRTQLNKVQNVKGSNETPKFFCWTIPVVTVKVFLQVILSYVSFAVKISTLYKHVVEENSKPSLVLDDLCIHQYDYSVALIGKVTDFGLLTNLKMVLIKEGFDNLNLKYLGGFWVLIEFCTKEVLEKFKSHVGVGVPMKAWTNNTFNKISSKWGELLFEEDEKNKSLYNKRLCIKIKMEQNIFETFKIIVNGRIFWIRAKEVSGWVSDFLEEEDEENEADDESVDNVFHGAINKEELQG
ncbi:nucleotide-binding alpha-beta plait domain-containing protein [Tanacetum coccineum]